MSADTPKPQNGIREVIRQTITLLGVNQGVAPETEDEFWYQVAIALGVGIPQHGSLNIAKQVLAFLDEQWDDDYRIEDEDRPSLEAYETLYERLRMDRVSGPEGALELEDVADLDEDDDSIGALTPEFALLRAETTQTNIETVLGNIWKDRLVLAPTWQRTFVWKLKKQRRLIESILLGLPVPSLLLYRDSKTGLEFVIDGRQRLETIWRFASPKPKRGEPNHRFKTFPSKEEGWRANEVLATAASKYYQDLPPQFITKFDTHLIVLHTFVDIPLPKLYQIFKRYNTGAEKLRAAEIRNAVYQASPLHEMMYRVAGEHMDDARFENEGERLAASRLRSIMKNKAHRYGAYDFVGRYFAFTRMRTGSVANATNDFMEKNREGISALRDEFVRVLNAALDCYEYPLIEPSEDGKFHAFLATIQMVSIRHFLLEYVDKGKLTLESLRTAIGEKWVPFATSILAEKQNSTIFWKAQRDWIAALEAVTAVSASSAATTNE